MLAGLVLTMAGGVVDTVAWHRRRPIAVPTGLRGSPASWALAGAGVAIIGASLPLWSRSNPWGTPRPPIPVG
jgi:hypothetical protein